MEWRCARWFRWDLSVGGPFVQSFRGLFNVYSRFRLHARRVAYATFYTEGFSSFVTSAAASIATGWNEPVPGRDFSPTEDQCLSRRTRFFDSGLWSPCLRMSSV